jgi:hypothetical protein
VVGRFPVYILSLLHPQHCYPWQIQWFHGCSLAPLFAHTTFRDPASSTFASPSSRTGHVSVTLPQEAFGRAWVESNQPHLGCSATSPLGVWHACEPHEVWHVRMTCQIYFWCINRKKVMYKSETGPTPHHTAQPT